MADPTLRVSNGTMAVTESVGVRTVAPGSTDARTGQLLKFTECFSPSFSSYAVLLQTSSREFRLYTKLKFEPFFM